MEGRKPPGSAAKHRIHVVSGPIKPPGLDQSGIGSIQPSAHGTIGWCGYPPRVPALAYAAEVRPSAALDGRHPSRACFDGNPGAPLGTRIRGDRLRYQIHRQFRSSLLNQALFGVLMHRVLSGIQPSGSQHIGHLVGALDNFTRLQGQGEAFYMIADWHALTSKYESVEEIWPATQELTATYLAAGLDPDRATIFVQSLDRKSG